MLLLFFAPAEIADIAFSSLPILLLAPAAIADVAPVPVLTVPRAAIASLPPRYNAVLPAGKT